jgi:hypothetical protein
VLARTGAISSFTVTLRRNLALGVSQRLRVGHDVHMTLPATPVTAISMLWQRQSVWSQAASKLKARITRSRTTSLLLIITGAVLGTAASQLLSHHAAVGKVAAAGAAVALALASFASRGASPQTMRHWTRARSVSEAIKAEVYSFLAGVAPFGGADRDRVVLQHLEGLMHDVGDLIKYTTGVEPADRPLPPVRDIGTYADVRVERQISGYYKPKARMMSRRIRIARVSELTLAALAATFAALVTVFPSAGISAWIGVLTTIAAAVAAHAGAARYEYQQIEFTRTADELERLLLAHRTVGDAGDPEKFVLACERVISIQNEAWMAKVDTQPKV